MVVHPQVDILRLWGHVAQAFGALGMWQLSVHGRTMPNVQHPPSPKANTKNSSATVRPPTTQHVWDVRPQSSRTWEESQLLAPPPSESHDYRWANEKEGQSGRPSRSSWIQGLCEEGNINTRGMLVKWASGEQGAVGGKRKTAWLGTVQKEQAHCCEAPLRGRVCSGGVC